MNVQKEYKRGGFFGNSQDRFSDMEGAGKGINMTNKGFLGGKGSALRKEKRYLKKLERKGMLNDYGPQSMDRLNYLKKVQKDRFKKIAGGAALAAGAVLGGPAALAAIKAKGAAAAGAKAAGAGAKKGGFKALLDLFGKAKKARKAQQALGESGFFRGMGETPGSDVYGAPGMDIDSMELGEIDEFGNEEEEGFEMGGKIDEFDGPYGKGGFRILKQAAGMGFGRKGVENMAEGIQSKGPVLRDMDRQERMDMLKDSMPGSLLSSMRVMKQGGLVGGQKRLDKNNDGRLSREDFELLRAMFGAKLPR